MRYFEQLSYKDSSYYHALLEKEILVKSNLMTVINTISADPIAKAIKASIVSNLAAGDNMVDFPRDVKTVDTIDLDPKRKDAFTVTYTKPDGKVITQQIKIGKLITKLMHSFKPENIEEFVAYINAFRTDIKTDGLFKVVNGDDIRKYYNEKTYEEGRGELANSCMKDSGCASYFDIYVENPHIVRLLVMFNEEKKVKGRALLWKLDDGDLYMDRVYVNNRKDTRLFDRWGDKNGVDLMYGFDNGIKVTIPKMGEDWEYMEYPYMDTFKYGDVVNGDMILQSDMEESRFTFQETDGGYEYNNYDNDGYDESGYDYDGYDGYDRDGYNYDDRDEDGFDRDGYNEEGFDRDGYNEEGFDINDIDREGFSKEGYGGDGYNRQGYNKKGWDKNDFDLYGYDGYGYDKDGYDRDGLDKNGNPK